MVRKVFISASLLVKQFRLIPNDVLDNSLLFFAAARSWMFPSSKAELQEAKKQPTLYINFDEDFKSFVLDKEEKGDVYWFRPECDYNKASSWLEARKDTDGSNFLPLILDPKWWKTEFNVDGNNEQQFTSDGAAIAQHIQDNTFEYDTVSEILVQSNPFLEPALTWEEHTVVQVVDEEEELAE
eukprot:TRINITY_DN996_c0_g1_i1.p1 TRINITY_DN996_c0_g1~~TRINITY_DN996_c0_g1_i1.p1  ORF type:complete len:183 (-),score=46.22 TRINITY_DN996_c0_g1_i1:105-653(-)